MTVGARLRGKAEGRYLRRFPRREREEEEAYILQHPQLEEEEGEGTEPQGQEEPLQRPGSRAEATGEKAAHSKKVHFAFIPERYEPLEEQTAGEKPKKKYRKKLKKYGKNVGKVITKGCRYFVIGLQELATAYSSPFTVSATILSLVR